MANKDAPFGARVVGKLGSGVANGGTTEYEIASGASGNIFSGRFSKNDQCRYYFSGCCR